MNLEVIAAGAVAAAKKAGKFIGEERKKFAASAVMHKGQRDLVSYVDVTAEKIIVESLQALEPGAGFLTEEKTVGETGSSLRWIIDPLDGTTNFIHGVPAYSVSIALQQKQELLVGVVYEINLDECFFAWKNGGAWCNDQKISVSSAATLGQSLLATGFPYRVFDQQQRYINTLRFLFNNTHGVRRLGSAAIDLAYVACGRFEGFFEYGLNAWDVAAGALIVKEAGGTVTDFSGGNQFVFGREIMASNGRIHAEFQRVIVNPPAAAEQEN
jgi:myo-inositol-1(or 4)-monophosphatase